MKNLKKHLIALAVTLGVLASPALAAADDYYVGRSDDGRPTGVRVDGDAVRELFVGYVDKCRFKGESGTTTSRGSSQIKPDLPLGSRGRFKYRKNIEWRRAQLRYHVAGTVAGGRASGTYVNKFRYGHEGGVEKCRAKTSFDIKPATKKQYERAFENRL